MAIKLDTTPHSTVVCCTLCPGWQALAGSKRGGWQIGADHEERAHPQLQQARDSLRKISRHADQLTAQISDIGRRIAADGYRKADSRRPSSRPADVGRVEPHRPRRAHRIA